MLHPYAKKFCSLSFLRVADIFILAFLQRLFLAFHTWLLGCLVVSLPFGTLASFFPLPTFLTAFGDFWSTSSLPSFSSPWFSFGCISDPMPSWAHFFSNHRQIPAQIHISKCFKRLYHSHFSNLRSVLFPKDNQAEIKRVDYLLLLASVCGLPGMRFATSSHSPPEGNPLTFNIAQRKLFHIWRRSLGRHLEVKW